MIRSTLALGSLTVGLACLLGCTPDDPDGSFSLTYQSKTWSGAGVSCKINTSYPEGDPERGKFFVSANDLEDQGFSMLATFLQHEAAPPAGDYAVGSEVKMQASFDGLSGDQVFTQFAEGTAAVDEEAPGFRVTFQGTPGLSGSVYCP